MSQYVNLEERSSARSYSFARWSIFSILIMTYILVYFHRMAPGVVSEYLMRAFQTSGAQLGTLSALYFFVYAFMQLPSGIIADTLGTRTSIICGNCIAGIGSILFGLSTSFTGACIGRFFVGMGVSVVFVSIMKSNSVWFHERVFGIMSGLTLLIGNLGSILAAGPLALLLVSYDWRTIFIGIGVFSLFLAVLGFLIIENRPEDMGFAPPNKYKAAPSKAPAQGWVRNLFSVLRTRKIWPGFWIQFGMIGSLYAIMGLWGVRYLQDVYTIERSFAAHHLTIMLLSFAIGALFFGWFSDKIRLRKPILIGCVALYLACWLYLLYLPWSPGLSGYILFGCMGFMGSGFVITFPSAKEVIHPQLSGMAVSVVNTGCFIGTSIMQPLLGYVMDTSWSGEMVNSVRVYSENSYHQSFLLVLFFSIIALVGSMGLKETRGRNIVLQVEE